MKNTYYKIVILLLSAMSFANAQVEICDNRIDDDGDGLIDCLDPDCSSTETCWDCLTEFYQVHSNSTLVSLDPNTGAYQTIGTISGASDINGAQFNHIDGHVYAPIIVDGVHTLGMLKPSGEVIPLDINLESHSSNIFYVGAIDASGIMYVSNGDGIHSINLNAEILEAFPTGVGHPGVADFALDLTNGLFYGVNGSSQLVVFDPFSLNVTNYDLAGSINSDNGGFGACWSSNDGSFFAYNNSSGKIYSVNPADLTATLVLNGTGNLSINDGFNCVLAAPPFESNCGNMIDDDGDGLADCDDPDCYNSNMCTVEICNNGIDDDNDGWIDCSDSECFDIEICIEICDNGIDDNNNGLIDSDDPQCSTPSGVTGGLESNRRLADKIAQRNFKTRVLESEEFELKLEGTTPFAPNNNKSLTSIIDLIPTELENAFVAESAPIDLIDITNAVDVAGADYFVDNSRVATVLGIYSEDGVYEHSKYICDRLDGSRLIDISFLHAYGGNFISYELINKNGQKEYAISFSAQLKEDGFYIENHWNIHKYDNEADYYNLQIWGRSYEELISLLSDILDKMIALESIQNITNSEFPYVFITHGEYQNGQLKLGIKNKNITKEMKFESAIRRTENGELETFTADIELSGSYEQLITIETGPIYDLGGSLKFPGSPSDEIYLADGSWGIDTGNEDNTINTYVVSEDRRQTSDEVFHVERSIELKASVKDYLNIYRSLGAKLNPLDLSSYNSLEFEASGTGLVEVTLVKESISEWRDQFRARFYLSEDSETFYISLDDFESLTNQELQINDVTMIVFTLLGNTDYAVTKEIKLSEVSFSNRVVSSTEQIGQAAFKGIYPNPLKDQATISFTGVNGEVDLYITNSIGSRVLTQKIQSRNGQNEIKLNLTDLQSGIYFYNIVNGQKDIHNGTFVKMKE